jgi:hypothetical protein
LSIPEIKTEAFQVDARKQDRDVLVLLLHGCADKAVFKQLEGLLTEVYNHVSTFRTKEVVFDLQDLFFVDSSSLSLFLRLDNLVVRLKPDHDCVLRFRLNPRLGWQKRSFAALSATSQGSISVE